MDLVLKTHLAHSVTRTLCGRHIRSELHPQRTCGDVSPHLLVHGEPSCQVCRRRVFAQPDKLTRRIVKWVLGFLGPEHMARRERASRLLEEALELAQAEGITTDEALATVAMVYAKPPGEPAQEGAGVAVTLRAWSHAACVRLDEVTEAEVRRMEAMDPAKLRAKHNGKADAGVALRATTTPNVQGTAGLTCPACGTCKGGVDCKCNDHACPCWHSTKR